MPLHVMSPRLRKSHRIANIPGVVVQGCHDVVCPGRSAWELRKACPKAEFIVTPASGHSVFEAENIDALAWATDRFA